MDHQAWLDQINEPILDPDRRICDPHHHLWDTADNRYLLDELLFDLKSGHNVVSTVFMECAAMYRADGPEAMKPVGETEFVNGIAAMCASDTYGPIRACAAIVGRADLSLGAAVGEVLDAHRAASARFVGIRHASGWHSSDSIRNSHTNPPQHLLEDAQFRRGIKELTHRNLSFDAWLYHPQIDELTALARACPEQQFVFDHFGGPLGIGPYAGRQADVFPVWRDAVSKLAQADNVVAKLGGLVMPLNGFNFHKNSAPPTSQQLAAATRDYYLHMIDQFGPQRCMFESNFPVDRVSCSYAVLWNSFKHLVEDFSESDKNALFHDTAARIYHLD